MSKCKQVIGREKHHKKERFRGNAGGALSFAQLRFVASVARPTVARGNSTLVNVGAWPASPSV